MPNRTANYCRLDYVVDSVDVMEGKKGTWAKVQGHYMAQDREGNQLEVKIRCTAFGVVADRFLKIGDGVQVRAEFEMGGWQSDKGYVNPDYVCVSVSQPWPKDGEKADSHDSGGMRRAAPQRVQARPEKEDDSDLPF